MTPLQIVKLGKYQSNDGHRSVQSDEKITQRSKTSACGKRVCVEVCVCVREKVSCLEIDSHLCELETSKNAMSNDSTHFSCKI